jgi:2-C-methyl-D-erythritol 2,4-cyclodiphosphate synthase
MFERFTEKARYVIFFARYQVSRDGDTFIRCHHLLEGLERVAPKLLREAGLTGNQIQQIRNSLTQGSGRPIPTFTEAPLDQSAKRALDLATEAAERLGHHWVTPHHLLWGIFHADTKLRTELEKANLTKPRLESIAEENREADEEAVAPLANEWGSVTRSSRSGIGYDLHRLAEGRKLIVGGVELAFDKGSVGHSDGDVLTHAICDALLGAAGLGDIGTHFPDTDAKWKGVSSLLFLEHIRKLLGGHHLRIAHIDAIVITERPKLSPHFPAMRAALAEALGIQPEQINLKAKTNEGVDAIGRGEAIAAQAIATLNT